MNIGSRLRLAALCGLTLSACGHGSAPVPTAASAVSSATPVAPPVAPLVPPRILAGTVRIVNGGPLEGVTVTPVPSSNTQATALTDASGRYELPLVSTNGLLFQKSGYRFSYVTAHSEPADETIDARLQRSLAVRDGEPLVDVITSDDLSYTSDVINSFWEGTYQCSPCKEIRVTKPADPFSMRLRLHWTGSVPLSLWTGIYYGGVIATITGMSTQQELVSDMSGVPDTVLVGVAPEGGSFRKLTEPIAFQLYLERQP